MATNNYDDIYSTYANQRYNRIDSRVLRRALKPYKPFKITMASARGKSDKELRSLAARTVLAKYRKAKRRKGA